MAARASKEEIASSLFSSLQSLFSQPGFEALADKVSLEELKTQLEREDQELTITKEQLATTAHNLVTFFSHFTHSPVERLEIETAMKQRVEKIKQAKDEQRIYSMLWRWS